MTVLFFGILLVLPFSAATAKQDHIAPVPVCCFLSFFFWFLLTAVPVPVCCFLSHFCCFCFTAVLCFCSDTRARRGARRNSRTIARDSEMGLVWRYRRAALQSAEQLGLHQLDPID